MSEKPVAANVLGTMGTVLWCVQLVPQIWHNWRRKKTDGLPPAMMFLWALCAVPFGVYMVLQQVNIPIQVQPQAFGVFCLFCWVQILYYNHGYSVFKVAIIGGGATLLMGGAEALLILTLRIPYRKGITWPNLVVGVVATILMIVGLIPPYLELRKRQGRVIGISWVFLGMDTTGAILSLASLVAEKSYDPLGLVIYIAVTLLEVGIMTSHVVWRVRFRKLRQAAKTAGVSVDDMLEQEVRVGGSTTQGEDDGEGEGEGADERGREQSAGRGWVDVEKGAKST